VEAIGRQAFRAALSAAARDIAFFPKRENQMLAKYDKIIIKTIRRFKKHLPLGRQLRTTDCKNETDIENNTDIVALDSTIVAWYQFLFFFRDECHARFHHPVLCIVLSHANKKR